MSTNLTNLTLQADLSTIVQGVDRELLETTRFDTEERIDVSEFLDLQLSEMKVAKKKLRPVFERRAKNFIENDPEILFVSEYIVNNNFAGGLVAWEKYLDATHYEIFKRNLFSRNSDFERVLFLDKNSLEEERNRLFVYVREVLGFTDLPEDEVFLFLDHRVKRDRIYEYRIRAARIPSGPADVDYDLALESKNLITTTTINDTTTATLAEFAGVSLGSEDLSWVISLINANSNFFGRSVYELAMPRILTVPETRRDEKGDIIIYLPRSINDVLSIVSESVALFGVKETFGHVIDVLGGISKEFRCAFLDAIDETRDVFSYDRFKLVVSAQFPVFELLLSLSESESLRDTKALSNLSITVPSNVGSDSLNTLEGLSRIFKFVNESTIAILYSQGKDMFGRIQELIRQIRIDRGEETEVIDQAILEEREKEVDQVSNQPTTVAVKTTKSAEKAKTSASGLQVGQGELVNENTSTNAGSSAVGGVVIR
jgi:hypothetical protein